MNEALRSFILGIVQGLTEFLPVSSSAHLVIIPRLFNWPDQGMAFDVALHLGTLLAVVFYYRKTLWHLATSALSQSDSTASSRKLILQIAIATIPAVVIGGLLNHWIEATFRSPKLIALNLIGAGLLLGHFDFWGKRTKTSDDLSYPQSFAIGLSQALALIPGISRSGITMTTALAFGLQRTEAARFSFLMAIPVIAGAGVLKAKAIFESPAIHLMSWGFLGAFLSGFIAIWGLIKLVSQKSFQPFVIYRVLFGLFLIYLF
jgi:undecaprenyl-diphosphatase